MQKFIRSRLSAVAFSITVLPCLVACINRELPATVRSHALVFQRIDGGRDLLSTPALDTGPGANLTLVSVGRGDIKAFQIPTSDDASLRMTQLGDTHSYTNWQNSGTALYAGVDTAGGTQRTIRVSTPTNDEVTVAAVVIEGRRIADMAWTEVLAGNPLTSGKVIQAGQPRSWLSGGVMPACGTTSKPCLTTDFRSWMPCWSPVRSCSVRLP